MNALGSLRPTPVRTLGRPTLLQAAAKLLKLSECRRFSGSFCGPYGASSKRAPW